jgi:hypothetical protein
MKLFQFLIGFGLLIQLLGLNSCKKDNESDPNSENPTLKKEVVELKLKTAPRTIYYFEDDRRLNLSGLVVTLLFNDNTERDIPFENFSSSSIECTPSHESVLNPLDSVVTIKYTLKGKTVKQPIHYCSRLKIVDFPTKNKYYLGEKLDLSGMSIIVTNNDGSTEKIGLDAFKDKGITCHPFHGGTLSDTSGVSISFSNGLIFGNTSFNLDFETMTDIDGNRYLLCKKGSQIWMAENLKTTHLNDGTSITTLNTDKSISYLSMISTPAYAWYLNDYQQSESNKFGAYYNYEAVKSGLLSPKGWHIPSKDEIYSLLYSTVSDKVGADFRPVKSGYIDQQGNGDWWNVGGGASYYWSLTIDKFDSSKSYVLCCDANLYPIITSISNTYGVTVRCIKDSE